MLIYIALLYFFLVCAGSWLLVYRRGATWLARSRLARAAVRRRSLTALVAGLVAFPPLVVLLLGDAVELPGYGERGRPPDPLVAALLRGEHLVPPDPLPPLAFSTVEVEQLRPQLASASRNWTLLDPEYHQRLLVAFRIMRERYGYEMALLEGYRSPARQDELARQGQGVTNAKAWQSYHQYGLAADCAFWRDGKLVISEKDPWAMRGYLLYGEVAESLGLTWGGRWKLMDLGHTELRGRRLATPQARRS
ncbi:MAG TPA: M15 family metallopeptidase [Telluria sp.]|nr:M15 family metallopeptidase [Telluria sp.]